MLIMFKMITKHIGRILLRYDQKTQTNIDTFISRQFSAGQDDRDKSDKETELKLILISRPSTSEHI